ncbi:MULTISPECIES: hypothetical protein [Candidatus Ichthyocystis]|uniref:hypothetical protein n=1 Tax=Candidatus Ichthyocystis TaxID=2929841 RepID=UPI000B882AB8|nr:MULTISPECIES: hypothetical protein [Ichthyocystis]
MEVIIYPVPVTSASAYSDVLDVEDDSDSNKEDTVQSGIYGSGLQQIESPTDSAITTSTTTAAVFNAGSDVLLGVKLHPDSAQIINDLFFKVNAFSRRIYKSMVSTQLPPDVSDKLTVTGRAIWYGTYRVMCEASFVYSCLSEYHVSHRPDFIHALPSIKVLPSSSDCDVVPLTGDRLLDFLSRLDCAVRSKVESVFKSDWNEVVDTVHAALEEESLNAVGCKDFIDVLNIAEVPVLALSVMLAGTATRERRRERNKVTGKCTPAGISVTGLTHSLSSASQSLPSQSNPGLSLNMHSQSEVQVESSLPLGDASSTPSEFTPMSSVVDYVAGSSSDSISTPSSCVSLSVQCFDLPGVKLHQDSAKIICKLFSDIRGSARRSSSKSMLSYILEILNGELTAIGKAIWFKTYKELHISRFVSRSLCMYHSKYRPDFIRSLPDIRVLSSSFDHRLVPLSGVNLLDFLSKLDCAVLKAVESVFNLEWDRVAGLVFSELEDGLLSDVSCEDFIDVLDTVGIPVVAFSFAQRRAVGSVSTADTATIDKVVSTKKDRGKSFAQKSAIATSAVFSSAFTVDSDVLSSLGVMLSSESALIIEDLFFKVNAFSRRIYKNMVSKQLPSIVNDKLTITGRSIWYWTYRVMCEDSFLFRCLGEYHAKHHPDFIRALHSIKVLSDSPDRNVLPLVGDRLLDFLSRLDCAIRSKVKSVFNSCWSKVSVSLEDGALNAVSCKDFINVLDIAGIPRVALSVMIAAIPSAKSRGCAKSKGIDKCTALGVGVTDLTHSAPLSIQSSPSQSRPELLPDTNYQSESQLGSSLPLVDAPSTSSKLTMLSSIEDFDGGSSSDPIAAEIQTDSGDVSVQCVDLLGVKLHPDSAELIYKLFSDIRRSARMSFSHSMLNYILTTVNSKLSSVGKAIWCKTYKELHLSRFMYRSICMYHAKYRPNFIRALDSVRVLSSSSDCKLVPLSGGELLGFLSRLDCAIREVVESIFNSRWDDEVTDKVFAILEDGSLSTASCEDFIRVLDVAGIPVVAFSISQRDDQRRTQRRKMSKGRISGSRSKYSVDGTESGSSTIDVAHSSVISSPQLEPELSYQPEPELLSESESLPKSHTQSETQLGSLLLLEEDSDLSHSKFVKLLLYRGQPSSESTVGTDSTVVASPGGTGPFLPPITEFVAVSTAVEESSSTTIGGDVLVSTVDGAVSTLGVLVDESSSPLPSILPAPLSSSPTESGLDADVSSFSPELPVLTREARLTKEGTVSASGVLAGESPPVSSDERLIMSAIPPSSVSSAAIEESSTTVSSSSFSYFRGPKKSFIMGKLGIGPFVVPTSSRAAAGPSSSVSMSSNVAASPLSSASVKVSSVPLVAANRAVAEEEDVGARLAALLNRGLPSSPPPAGESSGFIRGGRDGVSSSYQGSARRGSGRKRKRRS